MLPHCAFWNTGPSVHPSSNRTKSPVLALALSKSSKQIVIRIDIIFHFVSLCRYYIEESFYEKLRSIYFRTNVPRSVGSCCWSINSMEVVVVLWSVWKLWLDDNDDDGDSMDGVTT